MRVRIGKSSMSPLHFFALLLVLIFNAETLGQNCTVWNYPGWTFGMTDWPSTCPTCSYDSQSPIDLSISTAQLAPFDELASLAAPMQFATSSSWNLMDFQVENTGQKLALSASNYQISISGLGLTGYVLQEVHWHWGSDSTVGSEHTRNGQMFAMEGHIVLYNSAYGSFAEALGNENAVAVVAIWYDEAASTDNPAIGRIFSMLQIIPLAGMRTSIIGFDLAELLPEKTVPYFRYSGSVTTPACFQNITWTVFDTPISVSPGQMETIRTSLYFADFFDYGLFPMVNNYRMIQPLNGRVVYYVNGAFPIYTASKLANAQLAIISLFVSIFYSSKRVIVYNC